MKITIIGTGVVGQTLASKLNELGHEITMVTRNPEVTKSRTEPNPMSGVSFADWYKDNKNIKLEAYTTCNVDADLIILATKGDSSVNALKEVGKNNLTGKVLLDISNPLDFSGGMPPTLFISNDDSLAELIQREFPLTKVVKSLNTMNAFLMVNPDLVPGDHNVLVSGNDADAKSLIKELLESIGWKQKNIIDLGDIRSARATEQLLPIWVQLMIVFGSPEFNFHIVRK
jgi:predicted dinucleotide-binding enzyme